ncbi:MULTISPECIES: phage protein [Photorhabdus]|uniref:phage protein n=1 Tax=Photorhabdus TaxID=29487 RepID=UPI000DCE97AA|nr:MULTISPECIES: hypothetical protein [Photorhabdus]AXG43505.1 hypothetical protein PluDJC_15480 [Photorhabdus laumondii subsp. laumondii]NDL18077.1 hypothetical protein [Photorhabdus laumondii subsp. laumondii]NDL49878.1 hypothetical protein [Photorhabdus laumondii subsp. laumondii]NDL54548.1 hypothetical protein [Photorhabdus laumondii subsp. laumondii]RAW81549.1 hypothetical protein CKY09_18850 [Photorhabdus sp. S5P8-50]
MSKQWIRECHLIVVDKDGEKVNLSDLKITFNISRTESSNPATGIFTLYNLNNETSNKLRKNEFKKIKFVAGYKENSGQIFSGQIQYTYVKRDNATDTCVVIHAADGDEAHNYATVNTTIAAGYSQADLDHLLMRDIAKYGISAGLRPEFSKSASPRGKVLFGMHRNEVSNLAKQCDANWRYEDNKLHIVPKNKYLTEAIVLTSKTGLIGMPEQTIGSGINVTCLINPNIRPGTLIRLDNRSIKPVDPATKQAAQSGDHKDAKTQPAMLDADGDYIVFNVDYSGDTRETEWYMTIMCIAKSDHTLLNQSTHHKDKAESE